MACKTSYEFHHNFPKLAEESGFAFNLHRPRVHIDWNKIRLINVEELTRDRNFATLEQHINDIAECVLESEFDVRILDSGVVKLFRLAQLAVEYQQFCRHYLDRSVMLLRDELAAAMQDVQRMRKEIHNKEDEIKKLRKRYKHSYRPPLPYGNENIATMILRTLSQKNDIYTPTSTGEGFLPYNKCSYCDKVFLNQLYLQSHISRRHVNVNASAMDVNHLIPEKDSNSQSKTETERLHTEIMTLKKKIDELESNVAETNSAKQVFEKSTDTQLENIIQTSCIKKNNEPEQQNTTVDQNVLLLKLEEWKKEEHTRNKIEIESLRNQILENINLMKSKEIENETKKHDDLIDQLQNTIKEQTIEIATLRKELEIANSRVRNENLEIKKQTEERENLWMQRVKAQNLQYEELMRQLESIRDEARTARQLAEAEHARAHELQEKLKVYNNQTIDTAMSTVSNINKRYANEENINTKSVNHKFYDSKFPKVSLDELHRKAQELLSVVSTTSSDASSEEKLALKKKENINSARKEKSRKIKLKRKKVTIPKDMHEQYLETNKQNEKQYVSTNQNVNQDTKINLLNQKQKTKNKKKNPQSKAALNKNPNRGTDNESEKAISDLSNISPSSPIKVIRAKLNEEVNNQLVALGADPLRNGVQVPVFTKLRNQLQQDQRVKIKKNPSYEKTRNHILSCVDSKINKETNTTIDSLYKMPSTTLKKQFNLSTVLSNVKHRALSLMKSTDNVNKTERNVLNDEIVKRAAFLLKTPPESVSQSPVTQIQSALNSSKTISKKEICKSSSTKKEQVPNQSNTNSHLNEESKKINADLYTSDLSKTTETDEDDTSEGTMSLIMGKTTNNSLKSKDSIKVTASIISHPSPNEKSIETLIKSPVRRPATANGDYNRPARRTEENLDLIRASSSTKVNDNKSLENISMNNDINTKSAIIVQEGNNNKQNAKSLSEENLFSRSSPSTKGVLKNAPSTSSLLKKKVIFDLEANQMKSLSASPSQSTTEKSDSKNELKVSNLNEFDLSSAEDLPVKPNMNTKSTFVNSRTSSKITELTQRIESQLARRADTKPPSVGAIDVLAAPTAVTRQKSLGGANFSGSNTSLGSSVLDDTEEDGLQQTRIHNSSIQDSGIKKMEDREASDIDVSDFSIDEIIKNHIRK